MKFRDLLRLSTSNLFKRKLRTVLTVLGVTIGVASIVVMVSLGLGLSRSVTEEMSNYGSLTSVEVRDASSGYYYMGEDSQDVDENKHLDDDAIEEFEAMYREKLWNSVVNEEESLKRTIDKFRVFDEYRKGK